MSNLYILEDDDSYKLVDKDGNILHIELKSTALSTDSSGHEHKGKGEGGGQFVGKQITQQEQRIAIEKAAGENKVIWQEWASGVHQAQINNPITKRSLGVIKVKPDGSMELNDVAKTNFPELVGDVPKQADTGRLGASPVSGAKHQIENGSWRKTAAGHRVAMVHAEDIGIKTTRSGNIADSGKVKVGDTAHLAGELFTIQAIGRPFKLRGKDIEFVYLYPREPKKQVEDRESESPDDPLERMEWEHQREQGRSGELPGA